MKKMLVMPETCLFPDTVVLSNFALANQIYLLLDKYHNRICITTQVFDEIENGVISGYSKLQAVIRAVENGDLQLVTLDKIEYAIFSHLMVHLGKGEASCIACAYERKGIVLTDDRAARITCREREVAFTGTIGILKASVLDNHLTEEDADESLEKMISAGFYSPVKRLRDII